MPNFDAFRQKLTAKLYDEAGPFVEWVDKLEQFCDAQDRKIADLDVQINDTRDKDITIKSLEEELAHLTEDILDAERGIKTWDELATDARHRAA